MLIISIGRSPDNRIVISDSSNSVSSHHGEIKISDNGSIYYRDFSKNGSMVNGKIVHNTECPVQRGASIVFPNNSKLDWNQVPYPSQLPNVKKEITIGKNPDNQIQVQAEKASRYHAVLKITNDCKYYLYDQSMNGTLVNGNKIPKYQDYQVKRKDKIFFASTEKLDWKQIQRPCVNRLYFIMPVVLLLIGVGLWQAYKNGWFSSVDVSEKYNNSVCLVYNSYYLVYLNGKDTLYYIGNNNGSTTIFDVKREVFFYITKDGLSFAANKKLSDLQPIEITGSGFFASETGKIITNKHVAAPWESDLAIDREYFQTIIGYINTILGGQPNYSPNMTGIHTKIGVFLNDSDMDKNEPLKSFIECNYIRSAAEKEVDLALIQTKNRSLPAKVKFIESSDIISDKNQIKVGNDIIIMGFPEGFGLAVNGDKISSSSKYGKISQIRGKYEIQYDAASAHGASGSPVFNKDGKLIAVNYAGMEKTQGFNFGIIAVHIGHLLED